MVQKPAYFDLSVHHPLQDSLLCLSATTAGVVAGMIRIIIVMKLLYIATGC